MREEEDRCCDTLASVYTPAPLKSVRDKKALHIRLARPCSPTLSHRQVKTRWAKTRHGRCRGRVAAESPEHIEQPAQRLALIIGVNGRPALVHNNNDTSAGYLSANLLNTFQARSYK
jgi:hypothetical protein